MRSVKCETCKLKFMLMKGERMRKYCTEECKPSSPHFVPEMDPDFIKGQRTGTLSDYQMRYKYGIDNETFNRMLEEQAGVCAICWKPDSSGKRLAVDHCHETGGVRGLLCTKCNQGLGMFDDDPERMTDAAQYLREHHKRLKG